MTLLIAFGLVAVLFLIGMFGGAAGLQWVFGVALPYLAVGVFVSGLAYRVLRWANVPVPFRIPTTCGQQRALPWIRHQRLETPHDTPSVIGQIGRAHV